MVAFKQWLLNEERQLIDPAVLQSYEREFQKQLDALIQRSPAHLRPTFSAMKECPIKDAAGRCSSFTNYIVGAMIRQGCTHKYDPEESLQRIAYHMLGSVGEAGQPRKSLFDIDLNRDWDLARGNPLEARFKTFLRHDLSAICGGSIPRLAYVQRPPGTVSIGQSRMTEPGMVAADQIPAKSTENWHELVGDILRLLQRQEREHPELPLVDLFRSVLAGEQTRSTRSNYGRQASDMGRQIIIKTISNYARATENRQLLRLLDRFRNLDGTTAQRSLPLPKQPKPQMNPDEKDYRSIVAVMQQHGQRANLALLGKARRRWLEYKPRDPSSPHPNRLADVLARMIADGVLLEKRTRTGGRMFLPGPRYGEFVGAEELVGV